MAVLANPIEAASELLARRQARAALLPFMRYVWWNPHHFHEGRHTVAIANRLTKAVDDFREGKSTFLVINVVFRHGKSDICSRALTPFFLGRCYDLQPDVILSGYGAELVEGFSRRCQKIIESPQYQTLFPEVRLSDDKTALNSWAIAGSSGEVTAAGLGGAITGRGGALIVVDDYCKKREEAESERYRQRTWDTFKDDIMTRRAPACIVVVPATPWHTDDLTGRIKAEMKEDPHFPQFEFLKFGARYDENNVRWPGNYLFPERYDEEWYLSQYATLGTYSAAALMDCDPKPKSGGTFDITRWKYVDSVDELPTKTYRSCRCWDLASTKKERVKDDPDYTVGAKVAIWYEVGNNIPFLAVLDGIECQQEAPQRDRTIRWKTVEDGRGCEVVIEAVAGYKDTYTTQRTALADVTDKVRKLTVSKDKVANATILEEIIEAGQFYVVRGPWNKRMEEDFSTFPLGVHDDWVDAVSGGARWMKRPSKEVRVYG